MTWQLVTAADVVAACAYLAIGYLVAAPLTQSGQLRTNRLGAATALIFLSAAGYHALQALDMLLPSLGVSHHRGLLLRRAWAWHDVAWDLLVAAVGVYYLSLRGSYASVLRGAQMFEDLKVRERQALEINDGIVQGLTVAKYALTMGSDEHGRQAIEETLKRARAIITDLLGEPGAEIDLRPGDLRRSTAATVGEEPGTDGGL